MTLCIDVPTITRLVEHVGLENFLAGMASEIEADFRRWQSFDKCARVPSHSDDGVIELMPVADDVHYAFKYVNGHPINTSRQLPTVMAFGALSSVASGYPLLLSELTLTTAFRTAAASAVAARHLARPGSRIMGMIGCGAQSEFQAVAFHTLIGIEELRIFDVDRRAMRKLESHLKGYPGLRVKPVGSAREAAIDADIVTTVTADKAWATILAPDMIQPGMHINAVGGDCPGKTELHREVLLAGKIFVEYAQQTRIEGDIQQLAPDHPVTELWQVLKDPRLGREHDAQITIFDSVGFALEDFSALRYLHRLCIELEEGDEIHLVPHLEDPKDLFSLARGDAAGNPQRKIA